MSSQNYFDLLGDDENDEPTSVIARATLPNSAERPITRRTHPILSIVAPVPLKPPPPPPPSEAVKEQKPLDTGRLARGGVRVVRGGRPSPGDRDREVGLERDNRDVITRQRGLNDRNSMNFREPYNDGYLGNRGGGHVGSNGGSGTGGESGVGYGGDRASRGEGEMWSVDGARGRGVRGGRGRDRGSGGEGDERPRRREFDRRSGSGFGCETKRDGNGRGNWGAETHPGLQKEAAEAAPKEDASKAVAEGDGILGESEAMHVGLGEEATEKDDGDNELTLDEYEKILEEKRKALLAIKVEERKVQADKSFASMQLVERKNAEDIFIKLGSEKEKKKKEALEKEEKAKKTQSINEFLKPAEGEMNYGSSGVRGRGRGRGRQSDSRSGEGERSSGPRGSGNFGGYSSARRSSAPRIEDPGQFPTLGAK